MGEKMSDEQEQKLSRGRYEAKEVRSLFGEMKALKSDDEKVAFMDKKRSDFLKKYEEAGGNYKGVPDSKDPAEASANDLFTWYRHYCGGRTSLYPEISKKWRQQVEITAKKFGLDKIPLEDGWVTWGGDLSEPPKEQGDKMSPPTHRGRREKVHLFNQN